MSYDEFVDDFATRNCAVQDLGLTKVPCASTIKMFISRIETKILEGIIIETIRLTSNKNLETAVDSTGFQLEDGSYSYMKRIGTATKKRKNLKLSGCADTKKHLFLAVKIRKSNAHDSKDFIPLILKTKKTKQIYRIHGRHRKRLARNFPEKKYHRRSIIENMWFCVKRLCGKVVFAKKWINQKKELMGKVIAYNIHRLVQLLRI